MVSTNGICVTTMVNTRAGSSGIRRRLLRRRSRARADSAAASLRRLAITAITAPYGCARDACPACWLSGRLIAAGWHQRPAAGATLPLIVCLRSSLVGLPDRRGVALRLAQRLSHTLLAGDRRRDLLGDLGAKILEFRDANVLHAHVRLGAHARMAHVDAVDLVKRGRGEVVGGLLVVGVGVGRVTAAR